ncbi:MAG: hypothetical protein M3N14_03205 [Bacteroidota bacterium]|nr:hypothetical protein [Bacteroidota bacterium]
MKKYFLLLFSVFLIKAASKQITYPDRNLPTDTPRLFAAGILTDGLSNRDFTISPSGDEIFWTVQHAKFVSSTIIRLRKKNGHWGSPEVAPFSGVYRDLEASFSSDGNTLFFSSDRPVTGTNPKADFDIWKVSRNANGTWGLPENLGSTVNSDKNEFYPSVAKNGNLYFTVEAAYGKGSEDIVVCKKNPAGYQSPVSLPEDINTKFDEFNAFIDPDEQFIIFSCYGRSDDIGRGDLYISHKDAKGNWSPSRHLPSPVNSSFLDYCPYVTPDKKYLIFTSNRVRKAQLSDRALTYRQLKDFLSGPGNGLDDIYWVKFNKNW